MIINRTIYWIVSVVLMSIFALSCGNSNAEQDSEGQPGDSSQVADSTEGGDDSLAADAKDKKGKKKEDEESIPVEVTAITTGTISDYILLSSNLETEQMADVYSRVQGLVQKIYVEEGSMVKKNQLLMQLEADEYVLAEKRAKLNYLKQEADFKRQQEMFNKEFLSKEEFEQARYTKEGLKVDWEQAQLNLSYTQIRTPISGVIGDRLRKTGDRIQPTDRLFTVINTGEMIAVVYVPEKEIGNVQREQIAYISSDNINNQRFTGRIKRVSPVVDPQSGTFKVVIGVRNKNNRLRSGMFVNTHIVTDTHEDAVLIPKTAIVYENEQMNVFVVRDSLAHKIQLNVGFQDHEKVEALSDIKPGDKVIVVGQAGLKDQTRVKIVSERKNELAVRRNIFEKAGA